MRLPELAVNNITSKFEKANRSDVLQHSQVNHQNRDASNFGSKRGQVVKNVERSRDP